MLKLNPARQYTSAKERKDTSMINNDSSYLKAQREYDNQLPSSCDEELSEDKENSRREAYEAWQENKADEDREERMIELGNKFKIGSDINRILDRHIEE